MLKKFVGGRNSGLLFVRVPRPSPRVEHLETLAPPDPRGTETTEIGCNAFRWFRTTWLRKQHAPEDLIRFWLGHADKTVTDGYSKLKEDVTFRKKVAEQVGIGFELPTEKLEVAPNCTQSELLSASA